jgi:hypothetical protein
LAIQYVAHGVSRPPARALIVTKNEHEFFLWLIIRIRYVEAKRSSILFDESKRGATRAVDAADATEARFTGEYGDIVAIFERNIRP